jgi:hypothetical protein
MAKITFDNKVDTKPSTKPRINSVVADDINEIKEVVNGNANINEYSTSEQKIGTFMGKDLYRKTLTYNVSDLVFNNNICELDISSLNSDLIMVDKSHTFIHSEYTVDGVDYKDNIYMGYIGSSSNSFGNFKNASFVIESSSYYSNDKIFNLFMGSTVRDFGGTLYLTVEYTKNS